jgi:hypothetical protein
LAIASQEFEPVAVTEGLGHGGELLEKGAFWIVA